MTKFLNISSFGRLVNSDGVVVGRHADEYTQLIACCCDAWLQQRTDVSGGKRALLLGTGGGVVARTLLTLNPSLSVHCVELEPEVLEVAVKYFGMVVDNQRCTVSVGDAAAFIQQAATDSSVHGQPQDVIIVDCFCADGLAATVKDGTLLQHLDACLAPGGLCVVNTTWGAVSGVDAGARGETASALVAILSERFDAVYTVKAESTRNIVLLAHRGEPCSAARWRDMLRPALQRAAALCPDVLIERCSPQRCQHIVQEHRC